MALHVIHISYGQGCDRCECLCFFWVFFTQDLGRYQMILCRPCRYMEAEENANSLLLFFLMEMRTCFVEWGYSIVLCYSDHNYHLRRKEEPIAANILTRTNDQCCGKRSFKVDSTINRGLERRRLVFSGPQQQRFKPRHEK